MMQSRPRPPPPPIITISSQSQTAPPPPPQHPSPPPSPTALTVPEAEKVVDMAYSLHKLATSIAKDAVANAMTLGTLLKSSLRESGPLALQQVNGQESTLTDDETPTPMKDNCDEPAFDQVSFAARACWQLHEIRDAIRYLGDVSELIGKCSTTTKARLEALEVSVAVCNAETSTANRTLVDIEGAHLEHLDTLWRQLNLDRIRTDMQLSEINALLTAESKLRQERQQMLGQLEQESSKLFEEVNVMKAREQRILTSVEPLVQEFGRVCESMQE
eukprot:Protomagalhaensia_wolfi_Nauph_80__2409@NODE_2590_length_1044_cov_69_354229_g2029_i0_p1_GENE_NODE_2590_length_1044_cov_69_354229_g2029_i0NODE_2590_length_1044_cov_69_354229_g2029_i0_p1_ORF_typecomplete_len274_score50_66Myosin_tail_1/PF01576_19/0_066Phage_cap_P2/PF05125_12/0_16Seadorna_VP6/PF07407_11/1e02Seadorna_VP6/PF07407_11/1_5DUF4404/PF14357_6/1_8e04DUF4404/PF14357_6/0_26Sec2p/PF06428_11/2_5e03Sec2p/PF06428_11/0_81FUSC/PF04632_12/2e02FUSC/PF04632_12/4_5DUF3498/PF12004_8/6_4CCDC158/PF15921_5/1